MHGNVVALADETGNRVVNYEYDAWGNLTNTPESVTTGNGEFLRNANPFRYSSYQFDPESGLYYLKARYYSATIGRFISPDAREILLLTQGDILGSNLYVYCTNNPVMDSDPSGDLSLRAAGLIIDGILLLASIASAAMGLKASLKLIGIFSKNVIKQTKKKIVSIVKPILGTVLKAVFGFAVPTVAALTDYAVDLF